jgi:hypothetical protein
MPETATPTPQEPLEGIVISPEDPGGLVTVNRPDPVAIFTTPATITALLQRIKAEAIRDFTPDVTTEKGRKEIASRAFKVARTKTYLDNLGKDVVAELKKMPKLVDEGRKTLWDALEGLQKDVRGPLDRWEARAEAHKKELSAIMNRPAAYFNATAQVLREQVEILDTMSTDGATWEEFAGEAAQVKLVTLATMRDLLEKREKWEADQAELARLREADAKRKQEDKEEQLRKEGEARALAAATLPLPPVVSMTPEGPIVQAPLHPIQEPLRNSIPATPAPVTMAQADAIRRGEPMPTGNTDVEHRRTFNREALADLEVVINASTDGDNAAKNVLMAIVTGKVRHIAITY